MAIALVDQLQRQAQGLRITRYVVRDLAVDTAAEIISSLGRH